MLTSCPMCSRPFDAPAHPTDDMPMTLESLLLDEHGIEKELSAIIAHSRSDASKVTAAKYLTSLRAQRAEAQADKGWPAPETRAQYKERLADILRACGQSLVDEVLAQPNLWATDLGLAPPAPSPSPRGRPSLKRTSGG